jgi:2-dehydro-3-deoxyphosphogluconate aldolase/(4S)-4-hydroxy-2-oxoglutarate aldolase
MPTITADSILDLSPVIPVVVLDDAGDAVPLTQALTSGGVRIVEITLRTPVALEAIAAISAACPEMVVGAGTVTHPDQARSAANAGAAFLVSPGSTALLVDAMAETGLPYLPGVGTVSEVLSLLERGQTAMKFFPATAAGGTLFLRSVAAALPAARFCPTGGITPTLAPDYLALDNVGAVGGSWLAPPDVVQARAWEQVTASAQEASRLRRNGRSSRHRG